MAEGTTVRLQTWRRHCMRYGMRYGMRHGMDHNMCHSTEHASHLLEVAKYAGVEGGWRGSAPRADGTVFKQS